MPDNSPAGMTASSRRDVDPRLEAALLGPDSYRREEAARTIRALEMECVYAERLLTRIPRFALRMRANAGEALSLLGDPRFSPPYFLSEMIAVPAGEAVLGSPDFPDEQPVHRATVAAFSLAQLPVTQKAYAVFVQATRWRVPRGWVRGQPRPAMRSAPVVWVSARDAAAYCAWLSHETGRRYRLPTEAEWVLAARGAGSTRQFPWGDDPPTHHANLWVRNGIGRLCATGLFPDGRGPYGHLDLAGNVWEWCSSLYWPYPYTADDGREAGAADEPRVMHGGSWRSRPVSARCAARQGEPSGDSFAVVGFRLARDSGHG